MNVAHMISLDFNYDTVYKQASEHACLNYDEVKQSQYAGCYSCKRTFPASIITFEDHCIASNQDGTQEPTVFCPYCEVDYVIGDASGFPVVNKEFLQYMWEYSLHKTKKELD